MAKEVYSFRIESEVKKKLKEKAKKENRTVANLIETAIMEYLKKKK